MTEGKVTTPEGKGTMSEERVADSEGQSTTPEGSLFTIAEIITSTKVRYTIFEEHQFCVQKAGTRTID